MPRSLPTGHWSRWLFVVVLWASGCTDLPAIESGVCGNGLVDPGEDCDPLRGDADAGSSCRSRGAVGACHFSCARGPGGERPPCPSGWGCDANEICRAPLDAFDEPVSVAVGGASSLLSGDFDGDGRRDLVTRPLLDRLGRAPLTFHYFDRLGALSQTVAFPKSVLSPVVADLNQDLRDDMVFSGFDVGLLLGRVDRSWVPETFSSYTLPDSLVRTLNIYDQGLIADSGDAANSALVVLTSKGSTASLMVLDTALARLVPRGTLPGPLSELAGQPISANVLEATDSPCDEVVFAYRGARSFELVDLCKLGAYPGTVSWRPEAVRRTIALEPPAAIDGGPLFTDLNADGHLDVLLGAGGRPYVALGDGASLAAAVPYTLPPRHRGDPVISAPMPLATGDLTGDGHVDFVLDTLLLTSWQGPGEPSHHYETFQINERGVWTAAAIADLNGNGHKDVVAVSSTISGIDFFNGTGDRQLTLTRLPTSGPVLHLGVGDFDGDLLNDVVYVEAAPSADERETLMIAFGVRDAPPEKAVPVARLRHTEQVLSYREEGIDNLVVTSTQTVNGVSASTVTPLDGSSDRIPYSAMALLNFASDESFEFYPALTLAAGHFATREQLDVIALSTVSDAPLLSWQLWRVPAFAGGANAPEQLGFNLDPRLQPGTVEMGFFTMRLSSAAADLDQDGLLEFLVVASADGGARCGIERFAGTGQPAFAVSSRGLLVVDEPCTEPALFAVDLNGDKAPELALLTGSRPDNHKLFVFWNDRLGNFGPAQLVSAPTDSPRAVSTMLPTLNRPFATLAYATEKGVWLVSPGASGELATPRLAVSLERGSGVAAADIDGDGVTDLAAIDGGDLKVFLAKLRPL